MVPDIEREWIAEEYRTAPQSSRRLVALMVLLALAGALYFWLG